MAPRKPKDAVEPDAPETAEEPKADSKTSVTVTWPGGSRVYSKEVHGAGFKDLAKEFASKRSDRKVA